MYMSADCSSNELLLNIKRVEEKIKYEACGAFYNFSAIGA